MYIVALKLKLYFQILILRLTSFGLMGSGSLVHVLMDICLVSHDIISWSFSNLQNRNRVLGFSLVDIKRNRCKLFRELKTVTKNFFLMEKRFSQPLCCGYVCM